MFGHVLALRMEGIKPVLCVIQHEPIKENVLIA